MASSIDGRTPVPGDVYFYFPAERHCREGLALVLDDGRIIDTFWDLTGRDSLITHTPTDTELRDAHFQFNIKALRPAKPSERTEWYPAGTVFIVTSQHGHRKNVFVVPGTKPEPNVIITEARSAVALAEQKLSSAQSSLAWERKQLDSLLDGGAVELASSYEVE